MSDDRGPAATRIDLVRIVSARDSGFTEAARLYLESFPPEERRDDLGACLGDPRHVLEAIRVDGAFAGFVVTWTLPGFTFLEHVATLPAARGSGIGRHVLQRVLRRDRLVVAEAEPAERGPMAKRRLAYYAGLGLVENAVAYLQPSYGAGKPSVPMRLLSSPGPIGGAEIADVVAQLAGVVYGAGIPTSSDGSAAGADGRPNR